MSDSKEKINPFTGEPEETSGKAVFGLYRMVMNNVDLIGGFEGYTTDRYTDKNGNPYYFKGKKLNKSSKNIHVIQEFTCETKEGVEYIDKRDWMAFPKDPCYKAAVPGLLKLFGDKLQGIIGMAVEAQGELIEVTDGTRTGQCYKIVRVFKNRKERVAAQDEFFTSRKKDGNSNGSNGANAEVLTEEEVNVVKKHLKASANGARAAKTPQEIVDLQGNNSLLKDAIAEYGKEAVLAAVKKIAKEVVVQDED